MAPPRKNALGKKVIADRENFKASKETNLDTKFREYMSAEKAENYTNGPLTQASTDAYNKTSAAYRGLKRDPFIKNRDIDRINRRKKGK